MSFDHHPRFVGLCGWAMGSLLALGCSKRHPDPVPATPSDGLPQAPPGATGAFAAGRAEPPGGPEEEPDPGSVPDGGTVSPELPGTGPGEEGGVAL